MKATGVLRKMIGIHDRIIGILAGLSGLLLGLITLSVTAEVIVRKCANTSLPWVIECSEHALVFITFLAAAWVLKEDAHVGVDVVLALFGPRMRALGNAINATMGAVLCLFVTHRGIMTVWDLWRRHIYTIKTLEIPMAPLYSVIFVGNFFLAIQFLRRARRELRKWKKAGKITSEE
ncbi:MAG: TRAP transporter small permease [Pseudomonadota bacterium]